MWDYTVLQVIKRARSDLHSHGALQVTLGLEAPLRMGTDDDASGAVQGRVILVAANQPHWFESNGWAAALWTEPESRVGRVLQERYLQSASLVTLAEAPAAELLPGLLGFAQSEGGADDALQLRRGIERAWAGDAAIPPPLHPALRRATRHIAGLEEVRISAAELAEVAGVSESHLLHLFGDQLGIPLRRYVLWRRLHKAIRFVVEGNTATHAAQVAGFHDSAHLSRTFKQLLAVTPSELAKMRGCFEFGDEGG